MLSNFTSLYENDLIVNVAIVCCHSVGTCFCIWQLLLPIITSSFAEGRSPGRGVTLHLNLLFRNTAPLFGHPRTNRKIKHLFSYLWSFRKMQLLSDHLKLFREMKHLSVDGSPRRTWYQLLKNGSRRVRTRVSAFCIWIITCRLTTVQLGIRRTWFRACKWHQC